jgi:hypothetical protein
LVAAVDAGARPRFGASEDGDGGIRRRMLLGNQAVFQHTKGDERVSGSQGLDEQASYEMVGTGTTGHAEWFRSPSIRRDLARRC